MGWLSPEEQRATKKKYGATCFYQCDACKLPIPPGMLYQIDPKGGYHPWPKSLPKGCRSFMSRQPKVTYHIKGTECHEIRTGKRTRKIQKKLMLQAAEYILDKIEAKPQVQWTKERCIRRMTKKFEAKIAIKAMKFIRKEQLVKKRKGGYIVV